MAEEPPSEPGFAGRVMSNGKVLAVLIAFVAVILFESIWTTLLFVSTIILALFGFIHLFARGGHNKFILGVLPLILAIASLPELTFGVVFGDWVGAIPLIGWVAPGNFPESIFRYIILIGILLYYIFYYVRHTEALGTRYAAMGMRAGSATYSGAKYVFQMPSFWKILLGVVFIFLVYSFDTGGYIAGLLGLGDLSHIVVAVLLIALSIFYFNRRKFLQILFGVVALILGLGSISMAKIPFVNYLFDLPFFNTLLPGASWYRVILVIIIFAYFFITGRKQEF